MQGDKRHIIYLGLGSNLGDRLSILRKAFDEIGLRVGEIVNASTIFESEPVDFESEHPFLNQVICVASKLSPDEVLMTTQQIEKDLGRVQKSVNGVHYDRTCDIDILLYDDLIIQKEDLQIPHPRMLERSFVMNPLCEIVPDLVIPGTGKTVSELKWGD